ncbi:MAG: GNAT family N-acetyltransferase [Armatimonadota bacterium]
MSLTNPHSYFLKPLTCDVVQNQSELEDLRAEWNSLFSSVADASPCAHPDWTLSWWLAFGTNSLGAGRHTFLYVLTFRDSEGVLVAMMPMYEDQPTSFTAIRRLRSIGYLGRERAYDMTEEPTNLILPGYESLVIEQINLHFHRQLANGRWDFVAIVLSNGFELSFSETQRVAFVRWDQRSGSDYVSLPPTWTEYRSQMTKSMRENLPYYARLLTRHGHDWCFKKIDDPTMVQDAVLRLSTLHQARSESTRGTRHSNHLHGPAQIDFFAEFLTRAVRAGDGFIMELHVNNKVIASQAFYKSGDTLTVSYSGFDEAFYKYSPIFVINAAVFQEAQEIGMRKLNFLRVMAPWKSRWLAVGGPPMQRVFSVRRSPVSMLRYLMHIIQIGIERDFVLRAPILLDRFKHTAMVAFLISFFE